MTPRKLLIVDDSKLMHKMYEVMLRRYALVYALDGRQALDRLDAHSDIDLVLLDTNMPNMAAEEFMLELRAHQDRPPRVILITTEGRNDAVEGVDATIAKPFTAEQIEATIAQLPDVKADS